MCKTHNRIKVSNARESERERERETDRQTEREEYRREGESARGR